MREFVDKAISWEDYVSLIDGLLVEGKTTGPKQSPALTEFTRLNRQRMVRVGKTVEIGEDARTAVADLKINWIWLVLTEAWCGDAAQNLPVIESLAAQSSGIETRYLLRDENTGLMDQYLTNGTRSIPKLIVLDGETLEVVGTWGPRPQKGQEYFLELRSNGLEKSEINEQIQRWYNHDRGRSLIAELTGLMTVWAIRAKAKSTATN